MKNEYRLIFFTGGESHPPIISQNPLIVPLIGQKIGIGNSENDSLGGENNSWKVTEVRHIIYSSADKITQNILVELIPDNCEGKWDSEMIY